MTDKKADKGRNFLRKKVNLISQVSLWHRGKLNYLAFSVHHQKFYLF